MFEAFFKPKTIAIVGASRDTTKVGFGILSNVLGKSALGIKGKKFPGKIYAVNPNAQTILGLKTYPSLLEIPRSIDLVIIAVPAKFVTHVMQDAVAKQVKAAVIISAGFSEAGAEGRKLQEEVIALAKKGNISVLGPNCLGFMRPKSRLNASFAPLMPAEGHVGLISQSGALIDSILDWSIDHHFGMSTVISVGNQADVTITDAIEALGNDPETKVIALYIESLKNGKAFIDIAKKVANRKPIVAIKAGKTKHGSHAVSSHTGNLAGSAALYAAAFAQAGIHEVSTVEDLLSVSDCLARYPPAKGNIAIITNGGGCGVLCADHCEEFGVPLAELSKKTVTVLDKASSMHPAYSRGNPLDIVGDAKADRYDAALSAVLKQKDVGGVIVIQTLQTMTDPVENAKVIVRHAQKYPKKPILAVFLGGHFTKAGVKYLEQHGIKNFSDVRDAAFAMGALVQSSGK